LDYFNSLINCVTDDAFLKNMPDIDQALLQFIDVINLVAAAFSSYFAIKLVQICVVGLPKV